MVPHFHVHRFLFRAAVLEFTFKLGVDGAYSLFCFKGASVSDPFSIS